VASHPTPDAPLRTRALDHVVLVVRDVEASLTWYHEHLGLPVEGLEAFRDGSKPFASLRVDEGTILDLQPGVPEGRTVDHLAFVVDEDVDAVAASGRFEVLGGPRELSGARGVGRGIYVRDPDGHRIELRNYPPAG